MKNKKLPKVDACIFCADKGALSQEHIFSEWSHEVLIKDDKFYTQHLMQTKDHGLKFVEVNNEIKTPQGSILNKKIKVVCKKCNNGWMSRIDDEVKDILRKMILGEKIHLNIHQQKLVSTWFCLKTIVIEYDDLKTKSISQKDRFFLYNNIELPFGWKVFIGYANQKHWSKRFIHQGMQLYKHNLINIQDLPYNAQMSTFCLGKCVLHCFNSVYCFDYPLVIPEAKHMQQIWPIKDDLVEWPKYKKLSQDQLQNLAYWSYSKTFKTAIENLF